MTHVTFHFNVPDKVAYACRLLRKAHAAGAATGVLGPTDVLRTLDAQLWRFSALDFVPHCMADAPSHMLAASPIVLAQRSADLPDAARVLVHVGAEVPEGFERFDRLIELVSAEPQDRSLARRRWHYYKERGYALQAHDAAAR